MNREELYCDILAARPRGYDVVYIERRGEDYAWRRVLFAAEMPAVSHGDEAKPDVWIYYSGQWPADTVGSNRWRAFLDDLFDEMESMAGGKDRCRWPLDEPWPHRH